MSSDRIVLMSVPAFLRSDDYGKIFKDIVEELSEFKHDASEIMKKFASTIACKTAIKAGQQLSQYEMNTLFESLLACDDYSHCPHGRPTIIEFSLKKLEKMFGRI